MVKKTSPPVEEPSLSGALATETGSQLAADVFSLSLRAIRDEILRILSGSKPKGGGRAGGDATTRIANLSARAAVLAGELRKAEKAEFGAARELTHAMVLTWARQLSRDARARLLRDVGAIDNPNRRSVLG